MMCYITFSLGINVGLMNECFICCFDFIFTIKATATVLIGVNVFVLLTYTFSLVCFGCCCILYCDSVKIIWSQ